MPDKCLHKYPRHAQTIHVAPGVKVLPVDLKRVPAVGVFEWCQQKDGSFRPVLRVHEAWLRITEAARLPLGVSEEIILTLIRAGFVEGGRATPHSTTVNVVSLLEHIQETADDPDFWDRERTQRYKDWLVKRSKKGANGNGNAVPELEGA